MLFKASAPGSVMLMGEYAVLDNYPAIVCAIDKEIQVNLRPRSDHKILIDSVLAKHVTTIKTLRLKSPLQFALGTLMHFKSQLSQGCDIEINSDFSHEVGLGSSAAVTVALSAALHTWLNKGEVRSRTLIQDGVQIIRHVQGRGSGADVAASVLGGIIKYEAQPLKFSKFSVNPPLSLIYSGYKTPTADVIQWVQKRFKYHSKLYQRLMFNIGEVTKEALVALRRQNWQALGVLMTVQHGLMTSLGVNNSDLQKNIDTLVAQKSIWGAKISGSGLGDCVIGLGKNTVVSKDVIPIKINSKGFHCEKN